MKPGNQQNELKGPIYKTYKTILSMLKEKNLLKTKPYHAQK